MIDGFDYATCTRCGNTRVIRKEIGFEVAEGELGIVARPGKDPGCECAAGKPTVRRCGAEPFPWVAEAELKYGVAVTRYRLFFREWAKAIRWALKPNGLIGTADYLDGRRV